MMAGDRVAGERRARERMVGERRARETITEERRAGGGWQGREGQCEDNSRWESRKVDMRTDMGREGQ